MIKVPKLLQPLECHGFDPQGESGGELYGNCPLCDDERHFYVNRTTGQWNCKKCDASGNVHSFLSQYLNVLLDATSTRDYKRIAKERGIPWRAFKRFKVAWDGEHWILPAFTTKGSVSDLRRWRFGTKSLMATKGCSTQLFGLQNWTSRPDATIYLCEGEWDTIALDELMRSAGKEDKSYCVLGVPGSDTFKKGWEEYFSGRKVRLLYDNDEAGDRGSTKVGNKLIKVAKELKFINWPDTWGMGWDVRDHILAMKDRDVGPKITLNRLFKLVKNQHRRGTVDMNGQATGDAIDLSKPNPPKPSFIIVPSRDRPTFDDLIDTFSEWADMDDEMVNCLWLCLAVCLSEQIPGLPLWVWIIGASGIGKTFVLTTLQGSDQVIFRSSITPTSLVSGFKGAKDPSLLAISHGKILVFKDATELFSSYDILRQSTFSLLRGAYDGHVCRSYGNDIEREYFAHFSMLLGVTGIVNAYPDANLGERFLKFQFKSLGQSHPEDRIRAAMAQVAQESKMEEILRADVAKFLAQKVNLDRLPKLPHEVSERIIPLSQAISMMRANVDWKATFKGGEKELAYRPQTEYGTRLAKQIKKLCMALSLVKGENVVSAQTYHFAERIAQDTATGFHIDIVRAVHGLQDEGRASQRRIEIATDLPGTTVDRRLEDLCILHALQRIRMKKGEQDQKGTKGGRPIGRRYEVHPYLGSLLDRAAIGKPLDRRTRRRRS